MLQVPEASSKVVTMSSFQARETAVCPLVFRGSTSKNKTPRLAAGLTKIVGLARGSLWTVEKEVRSVRLTSRQGQVPTDGTRPSVRHKN
jgi:hypothetical protein